MGLCTSVLVLRSLLQKQTQRIFDSSDLGSVICCVAFHTKIIVQSKDVSAGPIKSMFIYIRYIYTI